MERINPLASREERKRQAAAAMNLIGVEYLSEKDRDQISRLIFQDDMTWDDYYSRAQSGKRLTDRIEELRRGVEKRKRREAEKASAANAAAKAEAVERTREPAAISRFIETKRPAAKEPAIEDINAALYQAGL